MRRYDQERRAMSEYERTRLRQIATNLRRIVDAMRALDHEDFRERFGDQCYAAALGSMQAKATAAELEVRALERLEAYTEPEEG